MNKAFLQISVPVFFLLFFFTSCEKDETDKTALITGLWIQEKITENGEEIALSNEEKSLSLLIEPNGVYRTYAKDAPEKEHFGGWTITDNTWLELSADTWRVNSSPLEDANNQWAKNHTQIRFTLLNLSDNSLEIRLKTYIGEKKYSPLFVEGERPLITTDNLDVISAEYKNMKTYTYTFRKE
ncbi:MAG: hypothetical protein LBP72_05100 [Dysgonamonadaceae bacterium]|jgi:hypothetical protein|nr:hypothetical protein [Dysgonamonadaceae bacterium]